MRRFRKRPELTYVAIPGVGRVGADRVLEGDAYALFCPSLLVELVEAPVVPPPASVVEAPAVVAVPAVVEAPVVVAIPAVIEAPVVVEAPAAAPVAEVSVVPPPATPVVPVPAITPIVPAPAPIERAGPTPSYVGKRLSKRR